MRLVWWIAMILGVFFVGVTLAMFVAYQAWWHSTHERYTVEKTDYTTPKSKNEIELVDDVIGDKNPTFDPDLIDSRPIEDWQVNKSAAVIGLDCPVLKPDRDAAYFQLHASYLEAAKFAEDQGWQLLPSANMIDGAGKQFDDGMFAAIELACFSDQAGDLAGAVALVRSMLELAEPGEASRPYLLAALELSGEKVPTDDPDAAAVAGWLQQFKVAPLSRPAGFYNWNAELQATWRTFKFLQTTFDSDKEEVARSLAGLLEKSESLRSDYNQLYQFYERLSNPSLAMSLEPLVGRSGDSMTQIMESLPAHLDAPSFLPQSSSRETELFQALFPVALPADANLMVELIKKIKSGEVDLAPTSEDGWYQHQIYALETLLLTDHTQESEKLLLTARYKKRLLEAFKAMMTKRRETHIRSLAVADTASAAPLQENQVKPRLRVEPAATFYLRTARAYRFVENLLLASLGEAALAEMHGLTASGGRAESLKVELQQIRERYYGFYLVACEDLGMHPDFAEGEQVDVDACYQSALDWLERIQDDSDLAADTRVVVPIFLDPMTGVSRMWGTVGVRLAKVEARFAKPPMIRPIPHEGDEVVEWEAAKRYQLDKTTYVILVDEFVEYTQQGLQIPSRKEFRSMCDRHETKEEIQRALNGDVGA